MAATGTQRGMSLIELMVSIVISSLLVAFVLGIYTQSSSAYRGQQAIAEANQTVRTGADVVRRTLRMAGNRLTRFRTATGAFGSDTSTLLSPLVVEDDAYGDGADVVRVFWNEPSSYDDNLTGISLVTAKDSDLDRTELEVADGGAFEAGDLVAVTVKRMVDHPVAGNPPRAEHEACLVKITEVDNDTLRFDATADGEPYNAIGNPHCDTVWAEFSPGDTDVWVIRFRAMAYRIDPERRELGVLQMSESGELEDDDWVDVGIGFADLQLETRDVDISGEMVPTQVDLTVTVRADGSELERTASTLVDIRNMGIGI